MSQSADLVKYNKPYPFCKNSFQTAKQINLIVTFYQYRILPIPVHVPWKLSLFFLPLNTFNFIHELAHFPKECYLYYKCSSCQRYTLKNRLYKNVDA